MSLNFPNLPTAIVAYTNRGPDYTMASLSRALSVSRATITRWKKGEEPEVSRIQEIAKELGVTVGYLAGDDELAHNDRERRILVGLRRQPEKMRALIEQLATDSLPEDS
jgi:transcriptional regulator with XRE-family HTH domain